MFLPPEQRKADIQFLVAKSLEYSLRLKIAFTFVLAGFVLEVLFYDTMFWLGLPLVGAGILMMLVKGYKNNPSMSRLRQPWRPSREEEVTRILEINRNQKRWDSAAVDITNPSGAGTLFGIAILVGMAAFVSYVLTEDEHLVQLILLNSAVIVLPFWLTGVRRILTDNRLLLKARLFLSLYRSFKRKNEEGEEFQFQIATSKVKSGAGEVPADVKGLVLFHKGNPDFLGLQMQVSMNSVQGKDYPYFYCVLVGHENFGKISKSDIDSPPGNVIIETKKQRDVYIAVIRQRTTKTSGYHTTPSTVSAIFNYSVRQARKLSKRD